jgi:DNA helicase IV
MLAERYRAARRELETEGREAKLVRRRFGHVIVDEAQGLSPMQWRMIARRCPSASMSILGDLGQAGAVWAPHSWEEVSPHVKAKDLVVAELTINYRTPTEIMDVAARVLAQAAPELRPPRSVRSGDAPDVQRVDGDRLIDAVADAVGAERDRFPEGKVAIVAPPTLVEPIAAHIGARHLHQPDVLDDPVAVLNVDDARGLEFDAVVVAEPSSIVEESSGGLRALYVALTRATQRVAIVHSLPLPPALTPAEPDLRGSRR